MKFTFRYIIILLSSFIICLHLHQTILAVDEKQVQDIADELRCPTCQGLSVKESDSGFSVNMKNKIRALLEEGKSKKEILQFFEERYGEWILRRPKFSGFNILIWIIPILVMILGTFFVLWKGFLSRENLSKQNSSILSKEQEKLIEQKLKELK